MGKIVLTDFGFNTCLWDKFPNHASNCFCNWGHCIEEIEDKFIVRRFFYGDIIRETEKAVLVKVKVAFFTNRFDITKEIDWTLWMPKSQIVKGFFEYVTDTEALEILCFEAKKEGKKVIGWD